MKKTNRTILVWLTTIIGGTVLLVSFAKLTAPQTPQAGATAGQPSTLTAEITDYNFGTISMANGLVRYQYKIKNTGTNPVTVSKLYTSCMCTKAVLTTAIKTFGPFGMPGHAGPIPGISAVIEPGADATVEAIFDPNAHGPAGVGRISRVVTLEVANAAPLKFNFSATVTP